MNQNKRILITLSLVLLVCIAAYAVYLVQAEKSRQESQSVYGVQQEETSDENIADGTTETTSESTEVANSENIIQQETYELEVLDYEWRDKFEGDDLKGSEYCNMSFYPEKDGDIIYEEDWVDWYEVREDFPEYDAMLNADENQFTPEERGKILDETCENVDKYRKDTDVKYDYILIKCRITNTAKNSDGKSIPNEIYINDQWLVASKTYGDWQKYEAMYFDKSVYPGDQSLFCYNFKPEETLEYTIGFSILEKDANHYSKWMIGLPVMIGDGYLYVNPSNQTDVLVELTGNAEEKTETTSESTEVANSENIIQQETYELEVLDYEWRDKFEGDDLKGSEYCNMSFYPEKDGDIIHKEDWVDEFDVREKYPEYDAFIKSDIGEYSVKERMRIEESLDYNALERETDVEYDYILIKCRITNTAKNSDGKSIQNEIYINDQWLVSTNSYYDWAYYEAMYFDKSVYPGDQSLFCYNFKPEETLEYTIGYAVPKKDAEYYKKWQIGLPTFMYDEADRVSNPSDQTKVLVELKR